jgi:leucyl aminopeptidase
MHSVFETAPATSAIPITFATKATWDAICAELPAPARQFALANGFAAKPGACLTLPSANGQIAQVVFGLENETAKFRDLFRPGLLPGLLPPGVYRFDNAPHDARLAALAFALGTYRFTRYRKSETKQPQLALPEGVDGSSLSRTVEAIFLARDLINTPSNDMGPAELDQAARELAGRHGAGVQVTSGDELRRNFPLVHAVGRGSARAPRFIDLTWGDAKHPKVTLVGKGVCFDTGGLDIKPSSGMLLMKKDMGGAAVALGLAHMIMDAKVPVRLRVLIPAVENSVSGDAFRPGDIFKSRKGLTVEIGNTDAEGRLILADALALADEEAPDVMIDFSTLTGAARVALGPELPAAFTDDDGFADELARLGTAEADPVWRLPLWKPYAQMLDSKIADMNNIAGSPFAGAITAALFLSRFVEKAKTWLHLDLFAWNPAAKPGRPEGGEGQTIRALFALIAGRYR